MGTHVLNRRYIFLLLLWPLWVLGASREIESITFRNVHFEGEEELIDIVQSEEGERFEPRLVKLDKILLTNYYKKNGFLDVTVRDSIIYSRHFDKVDLIYLIHEGQRYYYSGLRLTGNKVITGAKIAEQFNALKPYTPFDESLITDAVRKVEGLYANYGKPYMDVKVNYLYEQDSLIVVLLKITENQTVVIQDIRYQGLKMVKRFLIRRELEVKKGDLYNRDKIDKSQKNLYSTGLFKYVRFELEPVKGQKDKTILNILVQEKDPRWIGVRFGVAHEQEMYYGNKFELSLQGGHRNLFGTARSLSLHLSPSFIYDFGEGKIHNPDNKASLRFVEPWILYTRTPGVLQIAYEQYRPLNSGSFDLWKTSLDIHKKYSTITEMTFSLSAKRINILSHSQDQTQYLAYLQNDNYKVYSLSFYWKRDNRRNLFNPHRSSYTDASLAYSYSEGINTDKQLVTNNYILLNASWQRYQPWRPKVPYVKRGEFTLATRFKTAMLLEPGTKGVIPLNDLFYAGGANSVRGYGEQLLGPAAALDSSGHITQAAGGKLLFLANGELRMPIYWIFVGEFFVDAGYVWREVADFRPADIKFSTGVGLVALTPLGPLRVDYGYKLLRTKQDATSGSLHLGIYFAF